MNWLRSICWWAKRLMFVLGLVMWMQHLRVELRRHSTRKTVAPPVVTDEEPEELPVRGETRFHLIPRR